MDAATRKLIQNCSKVSATPSTAMRLAHLMTGEKYSEKKEHIFEQERGVVCGEDIINPDITTASNLLEVLDAMPNHSYLALIHDPNVCKSFCTLVMYKSNNVHIWIMLCMIMFSAHCVMYIIATLL
jgi:hypothetical protein